MISTVLSGSGLLRLLRPTGYGVLAHGSAVALMALSAWLLSRAAEQPPVLFLMTAIVGVRAFGLARGVFRYLERLAGHDVALRMQARLRVRVYERLAAGGAMPRGGDLVTRVINDVDAVQDLVVRVLVPIVSAAMLIVAAGAAITLISWPAGVLLLIGALLAGGVLPWWAARHAARSAERLAPLRARLADEVAEIARARWDLAAYRAEGAALARLAETDAALAAAERRIQTITAVTSAAQWLCTGAVVAGSLLIGGSAVVSGELHPTLLAVLALTPLAVHEVLAGLPSAAIAGDRCRSALRRVADLLAPATATPPGTTIGGDHRPTLQASGLSVGWPGGPVLFDDFALTVHRGERVALVGPSGSGKSSVANTVAGLIPPRGGSVAVPPRLGYLAQDAHLFDTTVAENVRIGARDATDVQVRSALGRVGLDLDLDRAVGEFGRTTSGGEARRLALARLAVSQITAGPHDLVILDEPTEHLDHDTAAAVIEVLWQLDRTAAILVLTHDRRLMDRCDRIIELPAAGNARSELPTAAVG